MRLEEFREECARFAEMTPEQRAEFWRKLSDSELREKMMDLLMGAAEHQADLDRRCAMFGHEWKAIAPLDTAVGPVHVEGQMCGRCGKVES